MSLMPVVATAAHRAHDPPHELNAGVLVSPVWERPARGEALLEALGGAGFPVVPPAAHGLAPVLAVHDGDLVAFLQGAWAAWRAAGGPETLIPDTFLSSRLAAGRSRRTASAMGLPGDWCFDTATPMVEGSWSAALAAVDVALTAADLVAGGERAAYALCRPPGHHAGRDYYGGFCFLNSAAVAARRLVGEAGRVAVLDVDFHHGNGTQEIFYDDPAVLYVSLHADPDRHFPYFTGHAEETGAGPGEGTTRNFPLPASTGDGAYLATLDAACEVIDRFDPAVVVVSLGLDTFERDPVGGLALTADAYPGIGDRIARLGRPTVWVQEGGYALDAIGALTVATLVGFTQGPGGADRSGRRDGWPGRTRPG